MPTVTVWTAEQMEAVLEAYGLTPTPYPAHGTEIPEKDLRIERGMRESSFYGCNHPVSTMAFSKEIDWCSACNAWRKAR